MKKIIFTLMVSLLLAFTMIGVSAQNRDNRRHQSRRNHDNISQRSHGRHNGWNNNHRRGRRDNRWNNNRRHDGRNRRHNR